MRSAAPQAALVALLSLLTACGGGGGGAADPTPGPVGPVAVQLVVTPSNQQAVAAEAVQIAGEGTSVADLGGSLVTGAQVSGGAALPGPVAIAGVARKMLAMAPRTPALATGVTQTETVACSGGGTVTVTASGSGSANAVPGDALSLSASGCVEDFGGGNARLNGHLTLTITAGSFDSVSSTYPKDVTLRMQASSLSLANVLLDGALDLHLVQSDSVRAAVTMTSPSFSWKVTAVSTPRTLTLKNYSHRVETFSFDGARIQISATVESDNPSLGTALTTYDIGTPEAVVVNPFANGMLLSGSMKVTGKGSALLMTVTGNDTLQLQVDTNGDGTYDTSRSLSRLQL
ncbi:hypothetical protein GCM10028796_52600 [Ramlibacter monticola]